MSDQFLMRWPELNKSVVFNKLNHNQKIFDWWVDQLPLRAVQGHVLVAGWGLSAWNIRLKNFTTWTPRTEVIEEFRTQPDGRVDLFMPMAGITTLLVKFGEFTETMSYPTIAQAREEDLDTLREVGMAVWRSVIKTKQIITVEYLKIGG
jgi:hypothetical protein